MTIMFSPRAVDHITSAFTITSLDRTPELLLFVDIVPDVRKGTGANQMYRPLRDFETARMF